MKPCSNNRKLIAWLAVDALDAHAERKLRSHLETCGGCRRYLDEISTVTQKLSAGSISSDIQASELFHQRLVSRLRAEASIPVWQTMLVQLRGAFLNWRFALPAIGAATLLTLSLFVWRPASSPSAGDHAALEPQSIREFDPTISNYQMMANRSMDKLDELLTQQGNRNPSAALIYTASTLARAVALD